MAGAPAVDLTNYDQEKRNAHFLRSLRSSHFLRPLRNAHFLRALRAADYIVGDDEMSPSGEENEKRSNSHFLRSL